MKTVFAATALAAAAPVMNSLLADYSAEVSLGYENLDANFSGEDLYLAGVRLHMQPLSYVGKTPYDEAAFFNQVGTVDMVYGRATGFGDDFDAYGVSVIGQSASQPHGFTASWFHTDVLDGLNAYEAGYHYYVDQGFRLGASVARAELEDDRAWSYGLNGKRLFSMEKDRWLSLDGGFGWSNDGGKGDWTVNGLATYYPSARSSVGVGFETTDRFADYDTVLSVTQYLREDLAVSVSYNRAFLKNDGDTDGISFGGKFRF